jgi:hypothetical protein
MAELHYTAHRNPDGWLALQSTKSACSLFIHLWALETGISGSLPIRLYKHLFSGWAADSWNLEKMCKEDLNKTATCASQHTAELYQGICYVLSTERFHATCINLISFMPIKQPCLHQFSQTHKCWTALCTFLLYQISPNLASELWKYG